MSAHEEKWDELYQESLGLARSIPKALDRADFARTQELITQLTAKLEELIDHQENPS